MRISHDDTLYGLLRNQGRECVIFLNGIKQNQVISADEEKGELLRYAATGGPETVHGRVVIEIERRGK